MIIDELKWITEPAEILAFLSERFPDKDFTDENFQDFKNLQVTCMEKTGAILVKFDKSEKVSIICDFADVTGLFLVQIKK